MRYEIRDLRESDIQDGAALLAKTWSYEHIASKRACRLQGLYDFYSCLARADIRLGAFEGDKLVGILLGSTGEYKSEENLRKATLTDLELVFEPGGLALNTYNKDYNRRSAALFLGVDKPELVLLMVEPKKSGIGSSLVRAYEEVLKKHGLDSYVVLSDTKCDYDFYENAGFDKIGEDIGEDPIEDKELSLFLYKKEL